MNNNTRTLAHIMNNGIAVLMITQHKANHRKRHNIANNHSERITKDNISNRTNHRDRNKHNGNHMRTSYERLIKKLERLTHSIRHHMLYDHPVSSQMDKAIISTKKVAVTGQLRAKHAAGRISIAKHRTEHNKHSHTKNEIKLV